MPRYLTTTDELSPAELERRYRTARDPVERTHWQVVWLVAGGRTCAEVAAVVGYTVDWVRKVVRRYNAGGPAALSDRRHANPGGTPLLTPAQQEELRAALGGPPPNGGLWTCQQVADWIGARVGRRVGEQRGWEYLCRLGFRPLRPRPHEARADAAANAGFTKGGSKARSTGSTRPTPARA